MGTKIPNMGTEGAIRDRAPEYRLPARRDAAVGGGLAGALFTVTQQRVLGLLFGQPERSFYATELMKLAGVGRGAVQRELQSLTDSGLVTAFRVGNQKHYQANPGSPIFHELCTIIRKTVGLAEPLRNGLEPIARKIHLALVFGSVAKHTDTAFSDIDLLVVADDLLLEDVFVALKPVETELGRTINPTLYSLGEFRKRRRSGNSFLKKVLAGEYMVVIGDDGDAQES